MDAKERDRLEGYDAFSDVSHAAVMEESCAACGCRVGDHWARLNGHAIGWVGCAVALARKVTS